MKEIKKHNNLEYVIQYPQNFDSTKKYPLLFGIHGAGSRGNDIDLIMKYPLFDAVKSHHPDTFIIVMPQCFADTWFEIFEQLLDFTKSIIDLDFVDKSRVYLTGASMGGYTSWQLAMTKPEYFSAVVPICGGGMYWNAGRLINTPIWAFHGVLDETVKPDETLKMVNAVNSFGGNAKITMYPKNQHDAWNDTYNNPEVFDWMLSHTK